MPEKSNPISVLVWNSYGTVVHSCAGSDRRAVLESAIKQIDPEDAPRVRRLFSGLIENRDYPMIGGMLAITYSSSPIDSRLTIAVYPTELCD